MSISDNDETATASSKSPPRKIRHRGRHSNDMDNDNAAATNGERLENLSVQEVIEISRQRVEALLHEESPHDGDIAVIPSLVSLSTAFFDEYPPVSHLVVTPSTEAPGELTASFPALSTKNTPGINTNNINNRSFMPTLKPRQWAATHNRMTSNGGAGGRGTPTTTQRPTTPPIGPQGAPIHSSLNAGFHSVLTQQAPPSSPNSRIIFSNANYDDAQIQLSAPGRLGGSLGDAARGASAQQLSQQPQQPQQQRHSTQQEPRYINAVHSLVDAVARLERRLQQAETITSSTPATNTPTTPKHSTLHRDNIDEIESDTITRLAEIMLHPPKGKMVRADDTGTGEFVSRCLWEEDTEEDAHGYHDDDGTERQMEIECNRDVADEDEEQSSPFQADLEPISKSRYSDAQSAHASVLTLGLPIPRRVCQHPFRRNDIVWVCRTCQSDETCVLCHECFTHSNHEGHDVAFYHAQAGGCCDCGDPDAWDPKGFCSKHGGTRGTGAPPGSAVASVEPSVLGGVHACADWLVDVVRDSVEDGYRRANPALFAAERGEDNFKLAGFGRSESSLVELEREDSTDIRRRLNLRRQQSLHRRNTVADVETMDVVRSDEEEENEGENTRRISNTEEAMRTANPSNIVHEVQFNPAAASSSKKWDLKPESLPDTDSTLSEVFDPEAAGSRAAKKAKAPPEKRTEKSPARALGDLGRKELGLFLVLHADDIHVGAHQPTEVIEALKELFSSPGGGGRQDVVGAPSTTGRVASGSLSGASYLPRPLGPRLAPRLGFEGDRPNNRYLFRAPQADAILNKVVRLVQKHGNIIVWGTQELLAECGDVVARCWRDGDPASSAMVGAAMLNRAKILTDRGLVCSIKTHRNLRNDQKATAIIRLIASVAQSCDPLCDQVSLGLSGRGISPTLNALIRSDLKLPCKFTTSWHALLLTLLAQPEFKAALAVAYCDTYRAVTQEYARGVGVVERSSFTLSVQFLNRVTYVIGLVRDRNLLSKLSKSLLETMRSASFLPGSPGSPPPAGASNEILLHSSSLHTESSNLAAILMALLGYFSTGGDEEYVLLELDNELNNVMNDLGEQFTGGDSRHHGRSAVSRTAKDDSGHPSKHHCVASLIKRTAALVNPTLNPTHPFLHHRRYSPCISDLKCVLNVKGMSRIFLSLTNATDRLSSATNNDGNAFDNWVKILSLGQWMDGQVWRAWDMGHVETEPRGWVGAFNTSISLGSVYERLLNWEDSDPCIIEDESIRLLSCAEVTHYTLTTGIHRWQRSDMLSYRSTPPPSSGLNVPTYALCPAALPFSTVASSHGSMLAMSALPLSQIQTWSFHLPLHRFVAACIREVSRRHDFHNNSFGGGGILELLRMFKLPDDISSPDAVSQLRLNSLLFRGLMEYPVIVLARAAQIRAGIWRRNGPGMIDQVLNYSEPPFCKSLQDSDILLVQFSLICHVQQSTGNLISNRDTNSQSGRLAGSTFDQAHGTSRLVNLLLHRFGVFDFLGFESAPPLDTDRYIQEIEAGFYPGEILSQASAAQEVPSNTRPLPWIYSPAKDFAISTSLVEELLTLLIILITEIPSPPPQSSQDRAIEAKRRLRREVIHRLVSGPKTHSEMAEVHHVLPLRDNLVLCDEGKLINPDDASGAALESVLNDVATRKTRIGDADQWELRNSAWEEYDPAFHRIGTRAHQCATEHRPKQLPGHCSPYAPKPTPSHDSFKRIRRDLTADASVLAIVYRVLHAYCFTIDSPKSTAELRGREMYENGTKSETALARAVHILTLGAFAWEEKSPSCVSWTDLGGGDIGSVFYHQHNSRVAPNAREWVEMALLRNADRVMMSSWYHGEENTLLLLKKVASEATINDSSLKSGAAWLCNFAAKWNSTAAKLLGRGVSTMATSGASVADALDELEKRKALAKERQKQAMERMKAQMAKFAQTVKDNNDVNDGMGEEAGTSPSRERSESVDRATFTTPIRPRADSDAYSVHAMDLGSPGEFILTTPPPSYPSTPCSGYSTPKSISHYSVSRLLNKRPQCIICGTDCDSVLERHDSAPVDDNDKTLAFCAYAQPSMIAKGGGGSLLNAGSSKYLMRRHVGIFVSLCGHAVHSSCCEAYLKTVHRDDRFIERLEGGKRKEFRCPLCQRLSNCLVPFIDVGVDWIESPLNERTREIVSEKNPDESTMASHDARSKSLHAFLMSSKWWSSRNEKAVLWDGHCSFSPRDDDDKKPSLPQLLTQSLSIKKYILGKKELISAWNRVLRTPRRVHRRAREFTPDRASDDDVALPSLDAEKQFERVADVWRRFMDTVTDAALKADTKRLGEDSIMQDYGEFRHYLLEKAVNNEVQKVAGKDPIDWPACISSAPLSEARRQELSKEKLISKLLFSIQSFTYSCCSESAEARRIVLNASNDNPNRANLPLLLAQFGIEKSLFQGKLLLFPKAMSSIDGGLQPFNGRLGKLRFLGLALMVASSPVSLEIIQLCMSFPFSQSYSNDPFDFDEHLKDAEKKRAPVVYPILCSHVLTHTTGCLIGVTGRTRTDEEGRNVDSVIDDCRQFIKLGFIARVTQCLLAILMPSSQSLQWRRSMQSMLAHMMSQKALNGNDDENEWIFFCLTLLQALLAESGGQTTQEPYPSVSESTRVNDILEAIESAKLHAVEFLRDLAVIVQVLIPNIFATFEISEPKAGQDNLIIILKSFMAIFQFESILTLLKSPLVHEVLKSWYQEATENNPKQIETPKIFQGVTWPQTPAASCNSGLDENSSLLVPFLGYCDAAKVDTAPLCQLSYLPKSYTDLYAELVTLCPDCDQIALCLVCGEVLNASGKGECSKHAFKCGGGAGIFFLLQECVGLMVHGVKAAYIHSPYVDSHGETPQYRGRPLNLDFSRYEILQQLWSGHKVREKVIAERGTTRQVIIPNFY